LHRIFNSPYSIDDVVVLDLDERIYRVLSQAPTVSMLIPAAAALQALP
jgi:hypothetical protein